MDAIKLRQVTRSQPFFLPAAALLSCCPVLRRRAPAPLLRRPIHSRRAPCPSSSTPPPPTIAPQRALGFVRAPVNLSAHGDLLLPLPSLMRSSAMAMLVGNAELRAPAKPPSP